MIRTYLFYGKDEEGTFYKTVRRIELPYNNHSQSIIILETVSTDSKVMVFAVLGFLAEQTADLSLGLERLDFQPIVDPAVREDITNYIRKEGFDVEVDFWGEAAPSWYESYYQRWIEKRVGDESRV